MATPLRCAVKSIGQGLSLAFWRRPTGALELSGFGVYLVSCLLALLVFTVHDYATTEKPVTFVSDGFHLHASYALLVLTASWLGARILKRGAIWLPLASLTLIIGMIWTAFSIQIMIWLDDANAIQLHSWRMLLAIGGFTAMLRSTNFLAAGASLWRQLGAASVMAAVLATPWYWQQTAWFWYPPEQNESPSQDDNFNNTNTPTFDAETIMSGQSALLEKSLFSLRMQTPNRIDVYGIGFAGDGSEAVFGNEVTYFNQLLAKRFDASERTISLINGKHPNDQTLLATLSNLKQALIGVAKKMDIREDVLVLFLTSHGSEDHKLYVGLKPLPLDQIRPTDLRQALDTAGIRWRVVVVSACFSGGFVKDLSDSHTLVITSARQDRSSFGCGNDSKITWFGKAFLTQALNQTTDFDQAFAIASQQVRQWELEQSRVPSVPQIYSGADIHTHLATWRAQSNRAIH